MANIELNVITRGKISGGAKGEVAGVLRDCYKRLDGKLPYRVEVLIADRESTIREFLKDEKFRLGITAAYDSDFVCSSDVWRGYPRISICYEKLSSFKKPARQGALRHEAAHTVLHGSVEYNIFRIPENCRHIASVKGLDPAVLEQALHNLSVAVKDFEATNLLVQHDFINCQLAFGLEWLQLSDEARSTWKTAQTNRQTRFIYHTVLLKSILFAHPLLVLPKSKKVSLEEQIQLGRRIEQMVEHLGDSERPRLLQVTNMIVEGFTGDTHKNVDFALQQAMSLA